MSPNQLMLVLFLVNTTQNMGAAHRFWQGVESGQILVEMLGFAAVDGFFLQNKEKLMIYGGFEVFANVLGVFVVFLRFRACWAKGALVCILSCWLVLGFT